MKTKITVQVDKKFHERVKQKSDEFGVSISEVIRRYLTVWMETGKLPKKSRIKKK